MTSFNIVRWVNRHDSVKLILITLVMLPVMRVAIAAANDFDPFFNARKIYANLAQPTYV